MRMTKLLILHADLDVHMDTVVVYAVECALTLVLYTAGTLTLQSPLSLGVGLSPSSDTIDHGHIQIATTTLSSSRLSAHSGA